MAGAKYEELTEERLDEISEKAEVLRRETHSKYQSTTNDRLKLSASFEALAIAASADWFTGPIALMGVAASAVALSERLEEELMAVTMKNAELVQLLERVSVPIRIDGQYS